MRLGFNYMERSFSEHPIRECKKSKTYSWTPSSWHRNVCLVCTPWHFNNF